MDRADEIAAEIWDDTMDCTRSKGIPYIAVRLRKYAKEAVAAERERCAKVAAAHPGACQTGCETGEEIAVQVREGEKA